MNQPGGDAPQDERYRPDLEIGYWLVALVDILGQKAAVRGIGDIPTEEKERAAFEDKIRSTFGLVETIRDGLFGFHQGATVTTEVFDSLPDSLKPLARELRRSDVKIRGVSDSVVFGVALKSDDEFVTALNGIYQTMFGLCGMAILALAMERPIRGAVEVGVAGEIEDGEIYGPALERAWFLESEVAAYPRILVGDGLLTFLHGMATRSGPDIKRQFTREMAKACQRFITVDSDGLPMLDFLGMAFREIVGKESEITESVGKAVAFVRGEHAKWMAADDFKLGPRYGRLRCYVEPRLTVWGMK